MQNPRKQIHHPTAIEKDQSNNFYFKTFCKFCLEPVHDSVFFFNFPKIIGLAGGQGFDHATASKKAYLNHSKNVPEQVEIKPLYGQNFFFI